jgi:hypothetical protein
MLPYIPIFTFLGSRWEGKRIWTEWYQALPEFDLLLISSRIKLWFVTVVPKYFKCATTSKHLLCHDLALNSDRDSNVHFVFSAFTSSPTSLLASHHQHRPAADVSHLVSVPHSFPGLS